MGVALCGDCGLGELRCERVAMCGSFGEWELRGMESQCVGVVGCGGLQCGGLQCGEVAVWGVAVCLSCSVSGLLCGWIFDRGSCNVGALQCGCY